MRNREPMFLEIIRARDPLGADGWDALREALAEGRDASLLRECFVALNRELLSALDPEGGVDGERAAVVCDALITANPELATATLGTMIREMTLEFQDPLVAVLFEIATKTPGLLALLVDVVETERQLVQFRVRAAEALVTKSPGGLDASAGGLAAQSVLRFLNSLLDELERGLPSGLEEAGARWAEGFATLIPSLSGGDEPQVLEWSAEALGRLASAPTAPETMRLILRILR